MSSDHKTDLTKRYQTNDSDINFIPRYVMECPKRENSSNDKKQDKNNMGAYADEALTNEEWLENYYRHERERLELEQKLRIRLDGSVEVSEW